MDRSRSGRGYESFAYEANGAFEELQRQDSWPRPLRIPEARDQRIGYGAAPFGEANFSLILESGCFSLARAL